MVFFSEKSKLGKAETLKNLFFFSVCGRHPLTEPSDYLVNVLFKSDFDKSNFNEFHIIDGDEAKFGAWPWQISLQMRQRGKCG